MGVKMKKIIFGVAVAAGVLILGISSARAEVQEGKWTMTIVTKSQGMEAQMAEAQSAMDSMSPEERAMMQQMMGNMSVSMAGGGITTTVTKCMTNNDPVPQTPGQEDCQTTHSINGNAVHFESVCKDSTFIGDITYEQDSMKGKIQSQATTADGQNAVIDISGQYLGPCE